MKLEVIELRTTVVRGKIGIDFTYAHKVTALFQWSRLLRKMCGIKNSHC